MAEISRFATSDASPDSLVQMRTLFFVAFDERFTEQDWEHVLGGWHVVITEDGALMAQAAVVPRVMQVANRTVQTGYVEGVATDPARRREGLGSRTMAEVARLLADEFEMGALSTSLQGFYERLGWERWAGPTHVQHSTGVVRTEAEDDGIMVLRFGPSKDVDITASITCEHRPGDDW